MNTTDAKLRAQLAARTAARDYARRRFEGRPKNGKGRLFPSGGALFQAAILGVVDVRAFEHAAREMWTELKRMESRP